jgi:hypothetical protein
MQDHEETCGTCGGRRDEPGMMSDDSYSQFPCPHPFHRQASPSRDGSVAAYERANERLEVALLHIINRISTEGRDDEHKHLFLVGSEAVKHARAEVENLPSRDGTEVCPWCEGSGWLCDGCQRPEVLCMASACRGAALSMSGCPKCFVPGECGGRGYVPAPSRDGTVAVEDATWRDVVAWLRRCRTAFHEDGLRWADLIEREFSPASTGDEEERAQNG